MPSSFNPSDALASLAATIHRWATAGYDVQAWLGAGEAILVTLPPPLAPPSSLPLSALEAQVRTAMRLVDDRNIPNQMRFLTAMKALQLLDDWHEPLEMGPSVSGLGDDHEAAWQRFLSTGGFNADRQAGLLVPHRCVDAPPGGTGDASVPPNVLLQSTAFLPARLPAGHPDSTDLDAGGRKVKVSYRPPSLLDGDLRPLAGVEPVIGIAPVLQQPGDASVATFPDPERYGIEILAGRDRLPDVVAGAMAAGVELLFMPEMTVREEDLDALASLVRRSASAHKKTAGELPPFRYLFAGCVRSPTADLPGQNYIVVMNLAGKIVLKQHKLTRWNLKGHHQYFYRLSSVLDNAAPDVLEDIEPGDELWIADLEGLGRFATLICADMGYNQPGGQIVLNVGVDWVHAPIMDKSIAWAPKPGGEPGYLPWVVDSAVEAAEAGARRVLITNSMLFTHLINGICVPGSPYPPFDECGIGFMLHRDDGGLEFSEAKVPISESDTIMVTREWRHGFAAFPPP